MGCLNFPEREGRERERERCSGIEETSVWLIILVRLELLMYCSSGVRPFNFKEKKKKIEEA